VTEVQQILKALKHRANGMLLEGQRRDRPGVKQQAEEIKYLLEMLEARLDP
jgi:hypothetical protein